jgi:hypothetical protein
MQFGTESFLGAFAKSRKATIGFVMSVCLICPSTRMDACACAVMLPLDGFSLNLIFELFIENQSRKFKIG